MKILVTGTAGFIGYFLAKKLLERGDEVIGIDSINDYYDINLKYARLKELGINKKEIKENRPTFSSKYPKHKFIKMDLADTKIYINYLKKKNLMQYVTWLLKLE